MKTKLFSAVWAQKFSTHSVNKLLAILVCCILCHGSLCAQFYSKYYYPFSSYDFTSPASYVIQQFTPSSNHNFDGTIMIQRVEDIGAPDDAIQITLVDGTGTFQKGFYVFGGTTGSFTPTCAAYNATTHEYCIAGIHEGTGATGVPNKSWFLMLDRDLNFLDSKEIGVTLSGISGDQNLYVTDITSVEGAGAPSETFAYVGVAGNTPDPSPTTNTTYQKEMYVGYLHYDNMVPSILFGDRRAFDFGSNATNNEFFPSRIIELPLSNPDYGFMITGSGPDYSVFFTRTDYHFADNGNTETFSSNGRSMYAGDLYYSASQNAVWFAGSTFGETVNSFIYQKLINLTSTGITLYSNGSGMFSAPYTFAKMDLLEGVFYKIAKIMQASSSDEAIIAANCYESAWYSHPDNVTFPTLHKIIYSNTELNDFNALGQNLDLFTYPRFVGNTGVTNFLSYLTYNQLHYPAHTAHYFPYGNGDYILGATCYDLNSSSTPPERIVLNRTDNYEVNDCNYVHEYMNPFYFVSNNQPYNPNSTNDALTSPLDLSFTNSITDPGLNDCDPDQFKTSHVTSSLIVLNSSVSISNSILQIKTGLEEGYYKMYNIFGEMILKGSIKNNYTMRDVSSLSEGIYLIQILDKQNSQIGIQKLKK